MDQHEHKQHEHEHMHHGATAEHAQMEHSKTKPAETDHSKMHHDHGVIPMMDKKAALKNIVQLFENGQANLPTTLNNINQLTGREIEEHEMLSYSAYTSLDNFCEALLTGPVANWRETDDSSLIREILDNKTNYAILLRNSEALAKKYSKTTAQVKEVIYSLLFTDELTILQQLDDGTDMNIS